MIKKFFEDKFGYLETGLVEEFLDKLEPYLNKEYRVGFLEGSEQSAKNELSQFGHICQALSKHLLDESYNDGFKAGYNQRRREEIEEIGPENTGRK